MKLSIFLAGYRTQNWLKLYESISNITIMTDYELVFVGPYPLPEELQGKENVRFIHDFGCPSRCYQLGLLHSQGEYVVWAADDGVFTRGLAIDKALESMPQHRKGAVSLTFVEGATSKQRMFGSKVKNRVKKKFEKQKEKNPRSMEWVMGKNPFLVMPEISGHYLVIMNALIRRDYLVEIGGWDCRFEHIAIGSNDLAVRLQNDGAEVIMGEEFMDLTQELSTKDHRPIEEAHIQNDMGLMQKLYNDPAYRGKTKIDFNNWKQAEKVWSRRFKSNDAEYKEEQIL